MTTIEENYDKFSWDIIDKYFKGNPSHLVKHHLESYNNFTGVGIPRVFKENNPIHLRYEEIGDSGLYKYECKLYLGGKDGKKIYYGKPIIYDSPEDTHYMFPNEARLRNMSYGFSIHYDVDIEMSVRVYDEEEREVKEVAGKNITINKVFLTRLPIMLQSNPCILRVLIKRFVTIWVSAETTRVVISLLAVRRK